MVFGAKRIPEIMGGLGKGIRSFKKSMEMDDAPPPPTQTGPTEIPKEKIEPKWYRLSGFEMEHFYCCEFPLSDVQIFVKYEIPSVIYNE